MQSESTTQIEVRPAIAKAASCLGWLALALMLLLASPGVHFEPAADAPVAANPSSLP